MSPFNFITSNISTFISSNLIWVDERRKNQIIYNNNDYDFDSESDFDSDSDLDSDSELESNSEFDSDSDAESMIEFDSDSEFYSDSDNVDVSDSDSDSDSESESELDSESDPTSRGINNNFIGAIYNPPFNINSGSGSSPGSDIESHSNSYSDSCSNSEFESESESELYRYEFDSSSVDPDVSSFNSEDSDSNYDFEYESDSDAEFSSDSSNSESDSKNGFNFHSNLESNSSSDTNSDYDIDSEKLYNKYLSENKKIKEYKLKNKLIGTLDYSNQKIILINILNSIQDLYRIVVNVNLDLYEYSLQNLNKIYLDNLGFIKHHGMFYKYFSLACIQGYLSGNNLYKIMTYLDKEDLTIQNSYGEILWNFLLNSNTKTSNMKIIKELIRCNYIDRNILLIKDIAGRTSLHNLFLYRFSNRSKILKLLLPYIKKEDLLIEDRIYFSCWHYIFITNDYKSIRDLLPYLDNETLKTYNWRNKKLTSLHIFFENIADYNSVKIMKLLLPYIDKEVLKITDINQNTCWHKLFEKMSYSNLDCKSRYKILKLLLPFIEKSVFNKFNLSHIKCWAYLFVFVLKKFENKSDGSEYYIKSIKLLLPYLTKEDFSMIIYKGNKTCWHLLFENLNKSSVKIFILLLPYFNKKVLKITDTNKFTCLDYLFTHYNRKYRNKIIELLFPQINRKILMDIKDTYNRTIWHILLNLKDKYNYTLFKKLVPFITNKDLTLKDKENYTCIDYLLNSISPNRIFRGMKLLLPYLSKTSFRVNSHKYRSHFYNLFVNLHCKSSIDIFFLLIEKKLIGKKLLLSKDYDKRTFFHFLLKYFYNSLKFKNLIIKLLVKFLIILK